LTDIDPAATILADVQVHTCLEPATDLPISGGQRTTPMTDDFGLQIRDALAHLYDYDYLARSALARALDPTGQLSARERMRQLRGTLLDGIEALNPGSDVSPYSLRQRS